MKTLIFILHDAASTVVEDVNAVAVKAATVTNFFLHDVPQLSLN
jgi:hypothetical protein